MKRILLIEGINPEPWRAPDLSIGYGKGRKPYPQASMNQQTADYQEAIASNVAAAYPDLPVFPAGTSLVLDLFFWRKLETYTTGTGRQQTRHRADRSNLVKATEDALQGILYANDVDVVDGRSQFVEQSKECEPRIIIVCHPKTIKYAWHPTLSYFEQFARPNPPGNVLLIEQD